MCTDDIFIARAVAQVFPHQNLIPLWPTVNLFKMPNKKKNSRYTSFGQYMKDRFPILRDAGLATTMEQAVPLLHPEWAMMSEDEKLPYVLRAKQQKAEERSDILRLVTEPVTSKGQKELQMKERERADIMDSWDHRMDSQGVLVRDREKCQLQRADRREKDRNLVRKNWPTDKDGIKPWRFYLIHFEYACELVELSAREYLPCELAVLEWSMGEGITNTYHKFIHPGGIPMGYISACQDRTDNFHFIPYANFDMADGNYYQIWTDLLRFIRPQEGLPNMPPVVYCMDEHLEVAQYCLHWLYIHSMVSESNRFRVVILEDVMQDLLLRINNRVSYTCLKNVLTTSVYDYEPNTRCKFHESVDSTNCSLAHVKRWGYALGNFLAAPHLYDFPLDHRFLPCAQTDQAVSKSKPRESHFKKKTTQDRIVPEFGSLNSSPTTKARLEAQQISRRPTDDYICPFASQTLPVSQPALEPQMSPRIVYRSKTHLEPSTQPSLPVPPSNLKPQAASVSAVQPQPQASSRSTLQPVAQAQNPHKPKFTVCQRLQNAATQYNERCNLATAELEIHPAETSAASPLSSLQELLQHTKAGKSTGDLKSGTIKKVLEELHKVPGFGRGLKPKNPDGLVQPVCGRGVTRLRAADDIKPGSTKQPAQEEDEVFLPDSSAPAHRMALGRGAGRGQLLREMLRQSRH